MIRHGWLKIPCKRVRDSEKAYGKAITSVREGSGAADRRWYKNLTGLGSRAGFDNVKPKRDLITSKLAALHFY